MSGYRVGLQACLVLGLQWVKPVAAQVAPEASHIFPPVGKPGTTVEVVLAVTDPTPDTRYFLPDPRLKVEVLGLPGPVLMPEPPYWLGIKSYLNDPNLTREVRARITIPADMPTGLVRWGVANASGAGEMGRFLILDSTPVLEEENRQGPQVLPNVPGDVCGRLGRIEEQDRYRFQANHTGMFTCELLARRLGSDFLGVLQVADETGRVVAEQFDTAGIDPVVSFPVTRGKNYTVTLRDVDFRGYRKYGYLLRFHPGPRVISASPSGGRHGDRRQVTFFGEGLATGAKKVESVTREVTFPATGEKFVYTLELPQGKAVPFQFPLSGNPEVVAAEQGEVALQVPGNHTAQLSRGSRIFAWKAKKGETVRLRAQRLDPHSGQDLELVVRGPDGKTLQSADDGKGSTDPSLVVIAPADGVFQVVTRDRAGASFGVARLIRLTADGVQPDFHLEVQPTLAFLVGGPGALNVKVIREGGFKEPITLQLDKLPQGVSVQDPAKLVAAPGVEALKVDLVSPKNAPTDVALVRVVGKAVLNGKTVEKTAGCSTDTPLSPWPVAALPQDKVLMATTLKPPFKIKPLEADGGRRVNRGATHPAELAIERDKDFQGEIVLDMAARQQRHRQGIRGPELKVPAGVNRINYPVFLPEGLETSRTSRIGLVARAQVKDPTGKTHWVTGEVEGQITMSIEGALLKVTAPMEVETKGAGTWVIPVQWQRSVLLKEPARLELEVPVGWSQLVRAEPVTLPAAAQGTMNLKVVMAGGKTPQGEIPVKLRLSTTRDGFPVVSEAAVLLIADGK